MRWLWFLLLSTLFPLATQAATLPQPSDVVFVHAGDSEEQQVRYNYIFTIAGDDTIYTCQANRCSLALFRDTAATVTATFYQLPEGYQRVATIVDQTTLSEYRSVAVAEYYFENLETNLTATGTSRSYHTVTIQANGEYDRDTTTQERNAEPDANTNGLASWLGWLLGGVFIVGLAGVGFVLWKRRN